MPRRSRSIDEVLTLLSETPRTIAAITAHLEMAQLRTALRKDEWSAVDVLAHLRACADVWGSCIVRIVSESRPTIRAVNPRAWIRETTYADADFGPSLRAFTAQRAELLAVLEPLPEEAWSRAATVTGAGKPLHRSVLFYADWMARHERPHIKQIGRIVAAARSREPAR